MYFRDGFYTENTKGFFEVFWVWKNFRKMALEQNKINPRLNECYQRVLHIILDKKFFDDRPRHVTPPTPPTPSWPGHGYVPKGVRRNRKFFLYVF